LYGNFHRQKIRKYDTDNSLSNRRGWLVLAVIGAVLCRARVWKFPSARLLSRCGIVAAGCRFVSGCDVVAAAPYLPAVAVGGSWSVWIGRRGCRCGLVAVVWLSSARFFAVAAALIPASVARGDVVTVWPLSSARLL